MRSLLRFIRVCISNRVLRWPLAIAAIFAVAEAGLRITAPSPQERTWPDAPRPSSIAPERSLPSAAIPKATFHVRLYGGFTPTPGLPIGNSLPERLELLLSLGRSDTPARVEQVPGKLPGELDSLEGKADLLLLVFDPNTFPPADDESLGDPASSSLALVHWIHNVRETVRRREERLRRYRQLVESPSYWKRWTSLFDTLARSTARTKTLLVMIPHFGMELDASYPFCDEHRMLLDLATTAGIPMVDLLDVFAFVPRDRLAYSMASGAGMNAFGELAHRLAAEYIYLRLAEKELVPETNRIERLYTRRIDIRLLERFRTSEAGAIDALNERLREFSNPCAQGER